MELLVTTVIAAVIWITVIAAAIMTIGAAIIWTPVASAAVKFPPLPAARPPVPLEFPASVPVSLKIRAILIRVVRPHLSFGLRPAGDAGEGNESKGQSDCGQFF
jgi:hypothetical protein